MDHWDAESIRNLADSEKYAEQAMMLRAVARIIEAEDVARRLRNTIQNHMEDLDGWYDLSLDLRQSIVENIASVFEARAAQKAHEPPKGFAPAPQR